MSADSTPPPDPQEAKRREYRRLLDYSVIGLVFPVAMVIGWFAGRAIGGWLGNPDLGGVIGGLFGVGAGFYNMWEIARKLAREDRTGGGG